MIPYMNEAVKMLERGDATVEDIDLAMKLGAGNLSFQVKTLKLLIILARKFFKV